MLFSACCSVKAKEQTAPTYTDFGFIETQLSKKPVRWDRADIPFVIFVDKSAQSWVPEIYVAINYWNSMLAAPLFSFGGIVEIDSDYRGGNGVITVRNVANTELKHPHTSLYFEQETGKIHAAPMFLPDDCPSVYKFRVAVHELGHVMGLDHDQSPKSIMYPYITFGPFEVTDSDVTLLKEWYLPAKKD